MALLRRRVEQLRIGFAEDDVTSTLKCHNGFMFCTVIICDIIGYRAVLKGIAARQAIEEKAAKLALDDWKRIAKELTQHQSLWLLAEGVIRSPLRLSE